MQNPGGCWVSAHDRKLARRARGIPELEFRDLLAAGWPEGMAHYGAYVSSFGARGCWKSARTIAGDKKHAERFPGELPEGRRGKHHANSLPRWRADERWKARYSSKRIQPFGELPGKKRLRSKHGAVHVFNLAMHRAKLREQRKQQRETEKPPGLVEHERRKAEFAHVGSLEEAMEALGFAGRPPPGGTHKQAR